MRLTDNSAHTQREKILRALRKRPHSTLELRHLHDILGVAPRIWELKWIYGFNIVSTWTVGVNPGGGKHRVVVYALLPGKFPGGAR